MKKIVKEFCDRNNIQFNDNEIDGYKYEVIDFDKLVLSPDLVDQCKKEHIIVITNNKGKETKKFIGAPNGLKSNGLRYLQKCPEPLIGIDIDLFKEHPEFPYRDDRPKCFYDVHVNNEPSTIEAFYDEPFRWNMIKNRIEYSGGFIDSHQVITAMNVTRKSKQPSWYSVPFAKKLLEKYATSNVIVDPFAGWGARYDACKELRLAYIGCDLNEDLVKWHQSKGRTIQYGDAEQFKYDGKCSVFICPPYQDVETYFDTQDVVTTQCQWLLKVMENVPNATEYIMTCKVIDDGWQQFVKEAKTNKSHFGVNNEWVIVVTNEEAKELLKEHSK